MFRFTNEFGPVFVLENVNVSLLLQLCQFTIDISAIVILLVLKK